MVVPPRAPRVKKESKCAFRKQPTGKTGVNGGKGVWFSVLVTPWFRLCVTLRHADL